MMRCVDTEPGCYRLAGAIYGVIALALASTRSFTRNSILELLERLKLLQKLVQKLEDQEQ